MIKKLFTGFFVLLIAISQESFAQKQFDEVLPIAIKPYFKNNRLNNVLNLTTQLINDTLSLNFKPLSIKDEYFKYCKYENFINVLPDTVWIKKKKNPIVDKHYKLVYNYKGVNNNMGNGYYTPLSDLLGKRFQILDVKISPKNNTFDHTNSIDIYMRCIQNGEEIIWRRKQYDNSEWGLESISLKTADRICKQELIGKIYYQKDDKDQYKKLEIIDCSYGINTDYFTPFLKIEFKDTVNKIITYNTSNSTAMFLTDEEYTVIEQQRINKLKESGHFEYILSKVIKPKNPQIRYGKTTQTQSTDELSKYLYEDNTVSILWHATKTQFIFTLNNKSDNSLKIIWDEASFIDNTGSANRIFHKGIKYTERNNVQPPTVIPQGSSITDLIAPSNRVGYIDGWYSKEMIDKSWTFNAELEGKDVTILLPIEIKGVTNEYFFIFTMKWRWEHPELR